MDSPLATDAWPEAAPFQTRLVLGSSGIPLAAIVAYHFYSAWLLLPLLGADLLLEMFLSRAWYLVEKGDEFSIVRRVGRSRVVLAKFGKGAHWYVSGRLEPCIAILADGGTVISVRMRSFAARRQLSALLARHLRPPVEFATARSKPTLVVDARFMSGQVVTVLAAIAVAWLAARWYPGGWIFFYAALSAFATAASLAVMVVGAIHRGVDGVIGER